jgi:NADPH-dependent glutamate synthase beta subunit-like oxidoreductase
MVAVILDNQVTAMTGFQQSPSGLVGTARPPQRTDIEAVVRALGAGHVEKVDPADLGRTLGAFERARDARGVSVIICEHPCPTHERRAGAGRTDPGSYVVDPSRCRQCGRSDCGLRCQLGVSVEHERHMARGRSLVVLADDRSTAAAHATAGPRTADGPPVAPVASCAAHCPLGLCIQGYAGHIAAGQHQEALALIMSRNPLPDSVCRVCHRPCERACVRAGVDEPVAVNDLKRFVMDWAARTGESYQPAREPDHGLSVAVVGAGPSGLAAAHELRLRGYDVTVLDAAAEPGGLLRYGIPRFRLPADALDRDVARILGLGVRFEGGRRLGADMTIDELFARGFDAVYLAVGASRSLTLSLPGTGAAGAPRLDDALALLAGDEPLGGEHIVVVGGGNAAVDAARTAVRRGAASVTIAYRRSRAEMPALPEEIEAALGEGIALETELGPVSLAAEPEGALACVRMRLAEPDASGRRRPVPIGGAELLLRADRVVVAVGQTVDGGFAAGATELSLADGVLPVDPASGASRRARVFAGGDLTAGPRTVTDAIADGQRAAWGIDRLLRGEQAAAWRAPPPRPGRRPSATGTVAPARLDPIPRARPPALARAERTGSFREVGLGLDEAGARAEARRCLACGSCGNCRCCLDVLGCPAFGVEDDRIRIDARVCTRCGQCLQICPNGAIVYLPAGEAPPLAGSPGGS